MPGEALQRPGDRPDPVGDGDDLAQSEVRALTDFIGNAVATQVVAKWEGELDQGRLNAVLIALRWPDPEGVLPAMVRELVDWRRARPSAPDVESAGPPANWAAGPELWREYLREQLPPLFGTSFSPGNWNGGIVRLAKDLVLLTTLAKGNKSAGNHHADSFLSPDRLRWQSQTRTRTRPDSLVGRIFSGAEPGYRVHLFVRNGKLRNGKAAPFLYCGQPRFEIWEGHGPISVTWQLAAPVPVPVPVHLRPSLGIVATDLARARDVS